MRFIIANQIFLFQGKKFKCQVFDHDTTAASAASLVHTNINFGQEDTHTFLSWMSVCWLLYSAGQSILTELWDATGRLVVFVARTAQQKEKRQQTTRRTQQTRQRDKCHNIRVWLCDCATADCCVQASSQVWATTGVPSWCDQHLCVSRIHRWLCVQTSKNIIYTFMNKIDYWFYS